MRTYIVSDGRDTILIALIHGEYRQAPYFTVSYITTHQLLLDEGRTMQDRTWLAGMFRYWRSAGFKVQRIASE